MFQDCKAVGNLIGQKILITEFPAFISLREAYENKEISERSFYITTYVGWSFVLYHVILSKHFSRLCVDLRIFPALASKSEVSRGKGV